MQVPSESIEQDSLIVSERSGYSTPKFNKSETINTAFTSTAITFYCSQNNGDKDPLKKVNSMNEENKGLDLRDSSDLDGLEENSSKPLSIKTDECIFSPSMMKS